MIAAHRLPAPAPSRALRAALRERIADRVERLIAILDELDGDPDHEDDGTAEPSLGWTKTDAWGCLDDREENATPIGEEAKC